MPWIVLISILLPQVPTNLLTAAPGLRAPPGFVVTEFADSTLANDILSMTVDPRGRIVVAGKGYIRILVDDDRDGRANRALPFADSPREGAQGMLWEGDSLFVSGEGGLRRFRVNPGGDHAAGPSELIRAARTGGEHESHAIKRGPDGWLYWLLGNSAGVRANFAQLPTSPIKDPLAGCVVRFSPDLKSTEIVADGFRNAYDFDFNLDGELFTFDSDNERCVSLPWYEGSRFYHVIPGGHFGWLNPQRAETWRTPPYVCDVVAPVLDLGRGSPTGVVCYRGQQFPDHYRGGFFLFDWTFGRVYFVKPERAGSSYHASKEVFLECTGDSGFAPTAALVHPETGDLFISIGGRGTRGAVYRVHYTGAEKPATSPAQPRRHTLDRPAQGFADIILSSGSTSPAEQLAALTTLVRFHEELTPDQIRAAGTAAWSSPDHYVRQAAANLLSGLDQAALTALRDGSKTDAERATLVLASLNKAPRLAETEAVRLLKSPQPDLRLVGARALQLLLGGQGSKSKEGTAWEGYSARLTVQLAEPTREALRRSFPSGDANLDRELSRTLAMIEDGDAGLLERVSRFWTVDSDPATDLHYLLAFARLSAPRSPPLTAATVSTLLALDPKITARKWNREHNWYQRVGELYAELARRDPKLSDDMLANPAFGRADHAVFARSAGFPKAQAARLFLARASTNPSFEWNADLVLLLGELPPPESLDTLRKIWKRGGLQEPVLTVLAKKPKEADREKFLEELASPQLATVKLGMEALEKLIPMKSAVALLPIVQALGRLPEEKAANQLRQQIAKDLALWTGQTGLGTDKEAWRRWFCATFPESARKLLASDGVDRVAWERRLTGLAWTNGDVERGKAVYQRASCSTCHSGAQALGPDLRGIASRFSRDDLFTAILQPSRDISSRYRTTQIITSDDKIYQGLIIYEAVDSLLLQTGPATTVRVVNQQIVSRQTTDISLMPAGLLDKSSDGEIVDLYAYLKSLKP
jgi:putative heme-binding domain-containing protein